MQHRSALLIAASLLASSGAAAEPALPAWNGVWRGTIGGAPARACLDGDPVFQRGSYYYLSRMTPIPLTFEQSRWVEHGDNDKVRAAFQFDKMTASRIDGQWVGSGESLALKLERVVRSAKGDDQGACGSMEYIAPRLGPTRVVESRGTIAGVQYRKLALGCRVHSRRCGG